MPMEETPIKRETVRRQVLAYLVLGTVLAVLLAGAIAARQGAFTRTAQLYFLADTAAGIAPGVGVRLSGFRIGSVSDVALLPDLKVKVTLEIEEQHFAALRADASADWFKEQLQAAIIELRPGSSSTALSRADPRVSHSRRKTLTEVANDLRARLAPVLDDIKQLTGTVAEHKGDITALLVNARSTTQELTSTTQELRALVATAKTQVAGLGGQAQAAMGQVQGAMGQVQGALGQTKQTLDQVATLVRKADQGMASVNTRLPQLLSQTSDTLEQLNQVARDVRAVSSAASAALPPMLRTAAPLVEETREVVTGVKSNWLLRSMMAPPPAPLLPIDSHDAKAVREPAPR